MADSHLLLAQHAISYRFLCPLSVCRLLPGSSIWQLDVESKVNYILLRGVFIQTPVRKH